MIQTPAQGYHKFEYITREEEVKLTSFCGNSLTVFLERDCTTYLRVVGGLLLFLLLFLLLLLLLLIVLLLLLLLGGFSSDLYRGSFEGEKTFKKILYSANLKVL